MSDWEAIILKADEKLLLSARTPKPTNDQNDAFQQFFSSGQICVDAGAGTGKTTTLIEIAGEAVIREIAADNENPFERMLIVSFGVEASRKLKVELKARLQDHVTKGGIIPPNVWRLLVTRSNIQTIDALILSLLREIAVPKGLALSVEIMDGLTQDHIVGQIFQKIRNNVLLKDSWERLESAYPSLQIDFAPETLDEMIWNTHQKTREFCWKISEISDRLRDGLTSLHAGKSAPFKISDLEKIVKQTRRDTASLQYDSDDESTVLSFVNECYTISEQLAEDMALLLERFNEEYTDVTETIGVYSYIDIAYLVWEYMNTPKGLPWKESLSRRFDYVLVDEYQDTSYVQNEIIKAFVRIKGKKPTKVLLIGDVKQSIYQWRSAESEIFGDLINSLSQTPGTVSDPFKNMVRIPLVTNFRSHPQLINFFNSVFSRVFTDDTRGAIAGTVPYVDLKAFFKDHSKKNAHVHVLFNDGKSSKDWVKNESLDIRGLLQGPIKDQKLMVRRGNDERRQCRIGDVALLFRRATNIPKYVKALRDAGIKCAVLADESLFAQTEVSFVVDILDWLANPDSKDSLLRLLRSPLVGVADETLRYLVRKEVYLTSVLNDWPAELLQGDKTRIESLLKLRDDLRWIREQPKAKLVSMVIAHSFLDTVVVTSESGLQAQANLWLLMEVVNGWEEEELLGYASFVDRLKTLRNDPKRYRDYRRAIVADEESEDCVKILTIHASKGLEFSIVILPDAIVRTGTMKTKERMVRNRKHGIVLRPCLPHWGNIPSITVYSEPSDWTFEWLTPGQRSALLWTSTDRDKASGQLMASGNIQSALREEQAEFWRLLYVAATRARDHLFLSAGTEFKARGTGSKEFEWISWMPLLRSMVQLDVIKTGNITEIQMPLSNNRGSVDVRIGLDELELDLSDKTIQPPSLKPTGVKGTSDALTPPMFIPSKLSPSTCGDLVECPRRYQYSQLWRVSGIRIQKLRRELGMSVGLPDQISADLWGTIVHKLFEKRDFSVSWKDDSTIQELLDPNSPKRLHYNVTDIQRRELKKVLANYEVLATFQHVSDAAKVGKSFYPEIKIRGTLEPTPLPKIPVEGVIDLLYERANGEWAIIDFKAEVQPQSASYHERIHRLQMDGYAWLAQDSLDINVSDATLVYLYPDSNELTFKSDPYHYKRRMIQTVKDLKLDAGKGLEAKPVSGPTGNCYLCPYCARVGGPCEHGN